MNSLAFIASVVGSLAVPVTIVVFLLLFRGPLTELLGRIISYEGLGQKVNFGQKLAGAERAVSEAVAQAQESVGQTQLSPVDPVKVEADDALRKIISTEHNTHDVDLDSAGLVELAELATSNPSFVVIKAWENLEAAVGKLVEAAWPGTKEPYPFRRLFDLVKEKRTNASFANAVLELRDLRNNVAHGQHNPTAGEAVTYVESVRELARIARGNAAVLVGMRAAQERIDRTRASGRADRPTA